VIRKDYQRSAERNQAREPTARSSWSRPSGTACAGLGGETEERTRVGMRNGKGICCYKILHESFSLYLSLLCAECRHIDLRNRSAGEEFPDTRNRGRRECTSSYLVGLALCPRRELSVPLTLYLETRIITNTKTKPFVRTRPSRSTHRLTLSIQHRGKR
jgi:hypothetical protein